MRTGRKKAKIFVGHLEQKFKPYPRADDNEIDSCLETPLSSNQLLELTNKEKIYIDHKMTCAET